MTIRFHNFALKKLYNNQNLWNPFSIIFITIYKIGKILNFLVLQIIIFFNFSIFLHIVVYRSSKILEKSVDKMPRMLI